MASVKAIRVAPRQPVASGNDLTILVRVPGAPAACRAYTAAEADEAAQYAAEQGGKLSRCRGRTRPRIRRCRQLHVFRR